MSTGGGPPNKPIEVNDVDILVRDILGSRVEGLQSEFGGDASISGTEFITIECEDNDISFGIPEVIPNNDFTEEEYAIQGQLENTQHETKRMDQMKEETKAKMDWSKSTPDNLRTPKSKVLISGESGNKRKRNEYETLCSKVSHWAEAKSSLEQIKISQMEKENNLKLKIMKDKSEAEIEMMRKETEARIDNSRKELEVTRSSGPDDVLLPFFEKNIILV
ncbi:uncharacterized protein [Leptinotarsa decemlineata]|uniref:uncharacterized protein n=1 Tax=Leptinotarsa decemlineata TaxID=7539 RepID=UPI003D307D3A